MKLYLAAIYNHHRNEWARVLLTSESDYTALKECEDAFADGGSRWKVSTVRYICETPEPVWTEV